MISRWRSRYPWFDHVIRAGTRYQDRNGDHYAAAITFFSVLSLVPMLMILFAIAGFVLAGNARLLDELREAIAEAVPGGELREMVDGAMLQAISQRYAVGVIGLLTALYSGLGWMGNLRDALTAQWGGQANGQSLLMTKLKDLLALFGLGAALIISFGVTAIGGGSTLWALRELGVVDSMPARVGLAVGGVLLSLTANWLVFLWVLSRLPREPVTVGSAVRGALVAALGFELLKRLGGFYLRLVTDSPSGAAFGAILGLLMFAYLVSRFLLLATAWTATSRDNLISERIPAPRPVVIAPRVRVRQGPDAPTAAGLLGAGALIALAARTVLRRR